MPPLKLIDHQPISLNAGNYSYSVIPDDDVNMVIVRVARQTTTTPTFFGGTCSLMLKVFVAKSPIRKFRSTRGSASARRAGSC